MKKYKILFADLDGTLIDTISGNTFPSGIWDMKLNFNVLDAIKKLNPEAICIVSNQGGIEKGFVSEVYFNAKLYYIQHAIEDYTGIKVESYFCPDNDPMCITRKPNIGMLSRALYHIKVFYEKEFNKIDCLMIGDASGLEGQYSDTDKKTAENFGIDYLDVDEFVNKYIIKTPYIK